MRANDYFYDAADPSTSRDAAEPKAFVSNDDLPTFSKIKKARFSKLGMSLAALPVVALTAFGFNHISGIFSDGEAVAETTSAVSTVSGQAQSGSTTGTATTSSTTSTNTASSTKVTLPSTAKVSFGSSSHATQASGKAGSGSFSGENESGDD